MNKMNEGGTDGVRDAAMPEASVSEALLAIEVFGGPVLDEQVLVDLAWITDAGIDQGFHLCGHTEPYGVHCHEPNVALMKARLRGHTHQADGHLRVVGALGPHAVAGADVVGEVHVLFNHLPGLEL